MPTQPKPTKKQQPAKPKKQVPLGQPLNLTDEDLDRLSQITPEDIDLAKQRVKQVSPGLAKLMDAQIVEDDETKPPE